MKKRKRLACRGEISRMRGGEEGETERVRGGGKRREGAVGRYSRKKEGCSGRKWPVQGGCNHLGFRYIEGHRYTQPPCVFHRPPPRAHVLRRRPKVYSTGFCEGRPKISGSLAPLAPLRVLVSFLVFFPAHARRSSSSFRGWSLRFFRLPWSPPLLLLRDIYCLINGRK